MSIETLQWVTTGLFFLCFGAAIIAETLWLARKGWTSYGLAAAYVLLSDIISLIAGFCVPFLILGTMLALAWGGGLSEVSTTGSASIWAAIIFAAVFPFVFLLLTKRVLVALFGIRSGRQAWGFAAAASVLSIVISFAPPAIFYYVLSRLL